MQLATLFMGFVYFNILFSDLFDFSNFFIFYMMKRDIFHVLTNIWFGLFCHFPILFLKLRFSHYASIFFLHTSFSTFSALLRLSTSAQKSLFPHLNLADLVSAIQCVILSIMLIKFFAEHCGAFCNKEEYLAIFFSLLFKVIIMLQNFLRVVVGKFEQNSNRRCE